MLKIKIYTKYIACILFCIVLVCAALFLLDLFSFYSFNCKRGAKIDINEYISKYKDLSKKELNDKYIYDVKSKKYRMPQNEDSKLGALLIFGGAYAHGVGLNDDETISYQLAKLSKRPVYNRAKADTNANHMYYQLSNDDFYAIIPKPEYIFYLYVPYQMVTAKQKFIFCQQDIFYKINKGKLLQYDKIPLFKKSYFLARINQYFLKKTE